MTVTVSFVTLIGACSLCNHVVHIVYLMPVGYEACFLGRYTIDVVFKDNDE